MHNIKEKTIGMLILFGVLFLGTANASVQDEIAQRQRQIDELQKKIEEYQSQVDVSRSQSRTLQNEITQLNTKISQITLEIRGLELSVTKTQLEINETEKNIVESIDAMTRHKNALARYLKIAYQNDQATLAEILFNNENLSDFFNHVNNIQNTQDNLRTAIQELKIVKTELENNQEALESKKTDLKNLISIQAIQKRDLDTNKKEKDHVFKVTKGQESKFQELIKKSQKDIEKIREQLTFLLQNGITAEDAVKYGQLAAIRAGIRPAFLLAILEIESRLGQNVGTGNWKDDMYE